VSRRSARPRASRRRGWRCGAPSPPGRRGWVAARRPPAAPAHRCVRGRHARADRGGPGGPADDGARRPGTDGLPPPVRGGPPVADHDRWPARADGLEDPLLDGKGGTGSRTTSWQAREAAQARQRNVQVARRATGGRAGEYLPQITAGVRARAASLSDAFPGIGTSTLDALNQGDLLDWKRPPSGPRCTPSVHPPHSSSRSATAARGPTGSRSRCSATTRAPAPWSTSKREGPPQTQRAAASSTPAHHDVPHRFRR
jgi:hypothetical protein